MPSVELTQSLAEHKQQLRVFLKYYANNEICMFILDIGLLYDLS